MTHPMIRMMFAAGILAVSAPFGGMTVAQTAEPSGGRTVAQPACPADDTQAEPATQPDATEDATAAENSGSTGWSGGTGGSQLGTNTQGAVLTSPTWQPPTARGLDLMGEAEPVMGC